MPDKTVNAKVVAEHFGVTEPTVYKWARLHRIPSIRASRRTVRFHLDEVEDALRRAPVVAGEAH